MDFLNVKTEADCEEIATMDAYDEHEVASGWLCCLQDVFSNIHSVKILDKEARLVRLDSGSSGPVFAVCKIEKKVIRISLSSIKWAKLSKAQKIWLNAYNNYSKIY